MVQDGLLVMECRGEIQEAFQSGKSTDLAGVTVAKGERKTGVEGGGCLHKRISKLIYFHFSTASREDPSAFTPPHPVGGTGV